MYNKNREQQWRNNFTNIKIQKISHVKLFDCEKYFCIFLWTITQIAKQFCVVIMTQGGGVAAPIASQVLGEVLPYLEVQKEDGQEIADDVVIPNLTGLTIKEAKEKLKEQGLEIEYEKNEGETIDEKEEVICEQLPKQGVKVKQGNKVMVQISK